MYVAMAFFLDYNLEYSEKSKNRDMPQRLQVPKVHKEMINLCLKLVTLCVFVPLWPNYTFRIGLKI